MSLLRLKDFDSPKKFFENRFMRHGMSSHYGGFMSKKTENFAYHLATEKMIYENSMDKFSILDVGSGLGNFYKFLKDIKKINFDYTGIDYNEKVNQMARLYHGVTFCNKDVYEISHKKKYDFVYCFGVAGVEKDLSPLIEGCFSLCKVSCAIQIFEQHPYLYRYNKEYQLKFMKKYKFINGYRHTEDSLIWFGRK